MTALCRIAAAGAVAAAAVATPAAALADETSSSDKLRILYSNRFTFTDDGVPLVTVEIASGRRRVELAPGPSAGGLDLRPDGEGGSAVRGFGRWTVSVRDAKPARVREWTVVARLSPDDGRGAREVVRRWTERGFEPRRFEVGSVFGVLGEVIDARRTLVAVAPAPAPEGRRRAARIANRYEVETSIHRELVSRPRGTVVAESGPARVENDAVLWFEPARAGGTVEVGGVVTGAGGSNLETGTEDRRYFGRIYVTLDQRGRLVVANAIPADRLLAGLVPAETFPGAHEHALEAQAIAARTELLQKLGTRHLTDPYLLCASQHCQVYSGAGHEHPRTTRAVKGTRGRVLIRDGGGLVDARYSAACGGHTEHNDAIWDAAPDRSLRGRTDGPASGPLSAFAGGVTPDNLDAFLALPRRASYCGATRYARGRYRWTVRKDADALSRRVADRFPRVGRIVGLEPLDRGVSGRVRELRIRGTEGAVVASGDLAIRRLLGGLKSTLFEVTRTGSGQRPDGFVFRGAGYGHGVGMCQVGAIGMAEQGHETPAILQHYYPHARLHRLY